MLTDWLDTGHWPQHPRELATEIVLGAMIFLGVHRLHRRAETYRSEAETDALTGLPNRRRFRADLEQAASSTRSSSEGHVLAILDVDDFKTINDTQGHAAGDEVLRLVASILVRSTRQGRDRCYRLGGDEFAVLLTGVGEAQALDILRRGFERAEGGRSRVPNAPVLCSVGLTSISPDEQPHNCVARADERMYLAKRAPGDGASDSFTFGRLSLVTVAPKTAERRAPHAWKMSNG